MMDKAKLEQYLKLGLGAVLLGVGGFAALFLIKSIVALTIVSVGGVILWNGLPILAHWAAQMKIKGHLVLARKNPVEELVIQYSEKSETLQKAAKAVAEFGTETSNYGDKVAEFTKRRPNKAIEFKKTYDSMARVYNKRLAALTKAKGELVRFESVIEEARDIWDMTQAAIKANRLLSKFTDRDPMMEIREKTALDAVYSSLNQVMAELDTAMALDYNALENEDAASVVQISASGHRP